MIRMIIILRYAAVFYCTRPSSCEHKYTTMARMKIILRYIVVFYCTRPFSWEHECINDDDDDNDDDDIRIGH